MISLVGVTQHYGIRPVLKDIDLKISGGKLTAVVGPNGMGKTTLLGVIAGTLVPQNGTVTIDGFRRRGSEEEELAIRRRMVYIPDHPWLPRERTGREYLLAVGALYEVAPERLIGHVERLLALFQLQREGDWPIRSYSNGQKKKVAIAAALVADAQILLLDEIFGGGLDPAGILALKHVLRRMTKTEGRTVVMTAPVPEIVEELADEVVVFRDGQVVAHDTVDGLRQRANCHGSLAEVLGRLIHPEMMDHVQQYFQEDLA